MAGEFKHLAPVTYDGLGPFPMQQHKEEGDIMRRSRYEFAHRDDEDQEPQGVAPLVWTGEFLFLNRIEGYTDLWPQLFMKMKRRVKQPELGYLEHPLYGPQWGYFETFAASYSKDELNGCRVSFTFRRVAEDEPAPGPRSFDNLTTASAQGAVADAGLAQLGKTVAGTPAPSPQIKKVLEQPTFTEDVDAFREFLAQAALTADTIAAEVNRLRAKIAAVMEIPELLDARNADVRLALVALSAAITRAGAEAQSLAAQIISLPGLETAMGALEIAQWLYEDASRAAEIVMLNPIEAFEFPKGFILRVADL